MGLVLERSHRHLSVERVGLILCVVFIGAGQMTELPDA